MPDPIITAALIGGGASILGGLFGGGNREKMIRQALAQRDPQIQEHLGNLQQVIDGTAPSVAQEQLRAALRQSAAQQQGMALAARPGQNRALARRNAMQMGAALNSTAAGQGALLRAQEAAQARGQISGLLTGLRGQDLQGVLGAAQYPTQWERMLGGISGAAQTYAMNS